MFEAEFSLDTITKTICCNQTEWRFRCDDPDVSHNVLFNLENVIFSKNVSYINNSVIFK